MAGDPYVGGPSYEDLVSGADTSGFDALAERAKNTRVKSAGRTLINDRDAYLRGTNNYQRDKIMRQYYPGISGSSAAGTSYGGSGDDFINAIHGGTVSGKATGDDAFLQGLADDTGNNGAAPIAPPTNPGNTGIVDNSNSGNTNTNTSPFDPAAYQRQIQDMINQMLINNRLSQTSTTGTGTPLGSNPTLSAGSVSNANGSAAARAQARNSGLVNTLASRSRGRRPSAAPHRYF